MEMNNMLLRPFPQEEIDLAFSQMHPTNAPGPVGMPTLFYQQYWNIVGSKVAEREGIIHGVSTMQERSSRISPFFGAGDSFLFFRAMCSEAKAVSSILKAYEEASGQQINYDDSAPIQQHISSWKSSNCLRALMVAVHSKYLGLPSVIGKSK
ncbi:hypothetical protein F0562_013885 [Nyssa sinensis]|uniref:Uncharacterized protein n=1 Tax=Nyssa sinensis TaxID=561372 RepID=A0A5J4ZLZ9_9ASTE|nr:hypothetical protein F0562_013885 [Nyssa sinensis]